MGRMIRFFKSKRGQSLVEMALVLPILLLLVAGAIDLGRAFNAKLSITNAAREGARYGSRYPDKQDLIKEVVRQELENSTVPPDEVEIEIDFPEGSQEGGHPIRVAVRYEVSTILGTLVDSLVGMSMDEIQLQSANEMIIFGVDYEE